MATRRDDSSDVPESLAQKAGVQTSTPEQPALEQAATAKRSSLLKSKTGERGYDFSGSYEQRRRVRFKFGVHSLAVEATLAKLFESLTMECRCMACFPNYVLVYLLLLLVPFPLCVCVCLFVCLL